MTRLLKSKGPGAVVPEGLSEDDCLTPEEVAAILDLDVRTLLAWRSGEYDIAGPPALEFTSSTVRYPLGELLAWIDRHYDGEPGIDRSGDRLLRRQEVVKMIGVNIATLERWQHGEVLGISGPLSVRISKSTLRFWESDVHGWMKATHKRRSVEKAGDTRRGASGRGG